MATRVLAGLVAVLMLVALLAGCSETSPGLGGPPLQRSGSAVTYVSIDEGNPQSFRLMWQQQFSRTALPSWTVSYDVNYGDFIDIIPSEWQEPETQLIDQVTSLRPTVVTVALGAVEVTNGISTGTFMGAFRRLLRAIRHDAVPTVLVANVIPLLAPGRQQLVNAYNAAIVAATRAEGDVLVDVHGAFLRAHDIGAASARDGSLTPLGQDLIATAFEKSMRHQPESR